ncbi:MAG: redoxin domain-containing protein [Candidatus Acidiferrales bacterium]
MRRQNHSGFRTYSSFALLTIIAGCVLLANCGRAQSGSSDYQLALRHAANLLRMGEIGESVDAYKAAIKLSDGKDYAPFWGLAQAYAAGGDIENVLTTCDQMLARAPNDAIRSQCHNLKGLALGDKGLADAATLPLSEAEFREALKLDSLFYAVHFNLACVILLQGRTADAVAEFKEFVKDQPESDNADLAERIIADPTLVKKIKSLIVMAHSAAPDEGETGGASGASGASEKDSDLPVLAGPPDTGDSAAGLRFPPGGPAPPMEFTTSTKQRILTGSLRGKVVLLDFWATWCGPCKEAYPELERMYNENDKSKFVLISINEDDSQKTWKDFLDTHHPAWMQAWDPYGRLVKQFFASDETPLPSYFVIDGKGNLHQFYDGWGNGQRRRVQSAINQWLAELPGGNPAQPAKH